MDEDAEEGTSGQGYRLGSNRAGTTKAMGLRKAIASPAPDPDNVIDIDSDSDKESSEPGDIKAISAQIEDDAAMAKRLDEKWRRPKSEDKGSTGNEDVPENVAGPTKKEKPTMTPNQRRGTAPPLLALDIHRRKNNGKVCPSR